MIRPSWQRAAAAACFTTALAVAALLLAPMNGRADEPYARSRTYDLQHVKTHLWFDLEHKSFHGEVTHTIALLQDNLSDVELDSVDLKINEVTRDGKPAKFTTPANKLVVNLAAAGKKGDKHEVFIR